jgi:hypothetical protein
VHRTLMVCAASGKDDGMRVSWNESFSHILDVVVLLLAMGRGKLR